MKALNISELRMHLPSIVDEVVRSREPVVVMRYGEAMATIAPYRDSGPQSKRYPLRDTPLWLADDFDEPNPGMWDALAVAEGHAVYGRPEERPSAGSGRRRGKGAKP